MSKFDKKNPADHALLEVLRSSLGGKVMNTTVPISRVIKNSINYRLTAIEYLEKTTASEAYMSLAREIIKMCEGVQ